MNNEAQRQYAEELMKNAEAEAARREYLQKSTGGPTKPGAWAAFLERLVRDSDAFEAFKAGQEAFKAGQGRLSAAEAGKVFTAYAAPPISSGMLVRIKQRQALLTRPNSDSTDKWLNQTEVAKRLKVERWHVHRLIKKGRLKTNGKRGRDCRVDPQSIIEYCDAKGIAWNYG